MLKSFSLVAAALSTPAVTAFRSKKTVPFQSTSQITSVTKVRDSTQYYCPVSWISISPPITPRKSPYISDNCPTSPLCSSPTVKTFQIAFSFSFDDAHPPSLKTIKHYTTNQQS